MKHKNTYIYALCTDYKSKQFLVYCPSGHEEDAIWNAKQHGWIGTEVIDWYNEREAENSGLNKY